jgi:transcriptional regulator with XRE-family HTH domain
MKLSKNLSSFVENAKKEDFYWVEKLKLDFALELDRRRRALDMTGTEFAKELGVSRAYVSKVFRGDANLTIESMVKIARAAGARVSLSMVDENLPERQHRSQWWASTMNASRAANHDALTTGTSDMPSIESAEVSYG